MIADISSTVNAAIGSRNWWDGWAEIAAWGVAVGVVLESLTEFDTLAGIIGLSTRDRLRRRIEKFGLWLLIVALIAEVLIGRRVREQTEIIESALTSSLRSAIAANADLAQKIKEEKTDIAGVKIATQQQRKDLSGAQGRISNLTRQAAKLRGGLLSVGKGESDIRQNLSTDESRLARIDTRLNGVSRATGALVEAATPRQPNWGVSTFKPFSQITANVMVGDDVSDRSFVSAMKEVLWDASWQVHDVPNDGNTFPGVTIEYVWEATLSPGERRAEAAAKTLCLALNGQHVWAMLRSDWVRETGAKPRDAIPTGGILIRVGPKPNHLSGPTVEDLINSPKRTEADLCGE